MNDTRPIDKKRRQLLNAALAIGAGIGAGAGGALITGPRSAQAAARNHELSLNATDHGLRPSKRRDQTRAFQSAIDQAANKNLALHLAPGVYIAGPLILRPGSQIIGVPNNTRLIYNGNGAHLTAHKADGIFLDGLELDGNIKPLDPGAGTDALISFSHCNNIKLKNIHVTQSLINGISLRACSGHLTDLTISSCTNTGIFCLDSSSLIISHSKISDCGNNGIQIWGSKNREDGTLVSNCHIHNIKATSGGNGQNGNGINIFRAGSVTVTTNHITDCAFSAIRGNAASNLIMSANNCARLGEVALYAEFGFEGTVISGNIIDQAATGISVTNFNDGGRLAIVQGNLIRNLKRREHSVDKRGLGISVEADTLVSANVIEDAETMGISVGWGKFMRDISATGNIIRNAPIGIGISAEQNEHLVHVANNLISGSQNGAIRAMSYNQPVGPDLARTGTKNHRNFALSGNVAS